MTVTGAYDRILLRVTSGDWALPDGTHSDSVTDERYFLAHFFERVMLHSRTAYCSHCVGRFATCAFYHSLRDAMAHSCSTPTITTHSSPLFLPPMVAAATRGDDIQHFHLLFGCLRSGGDDYTRWYCLTLRYLPPCHSFICW